jgi:hypothetical protein
MAQLKLAANLRKPVLPLPLVKILGATNPYLQAISLKHQIM